MPDQRQDEYEFAFKEVLRTENGRKVLWRMIQDSGMFSPSFDTDPIKQAYSNGLRNSGVRLYNEISREHPVFFDMMVQESRINHADE